MLFQESCKSEHTRKIYLYYLDRFMAFSKITDYDTLAGTKPEQLQIMIEDYIMSLKKQVSPNTVQPMIYGVKSFLDANDIELKWRKIQKLFPEKVKRSGKLAWTRPQIYLMLKSARDSRARALIYFLSASGVRIGALPDLKIKHLSQIESCKVVTVYPDTKDEYITFLTPEASEALEQYFDKRKQDHENFNQNTPVFRSMYTVGSATPKAESKASLQEIIRHILIKAGIREKNPGVYKRHETQIDHGFRKYFNEIMKTTDGINLSYAEKMLGHSVTISLDNHYLNNDLDKMFKEYKKAIPYLTIDETQRQQLKIDELKDETKLLQAKEQEVKNIYEAFETYKEAAKATLESHKKRIEQQDQTLSNICKTILEGQKEPADKAVYKIVDEIMKLNKDIEKNQE